MTKAYVNSLYQKYLGREAEEEGLNYWVNKIDSGEATKEQVEEGIANSPEAQAKNKDSLDGFILKFEFSVAQTNAILNVLGNAPYAQVANLVELIRKQGEPQFKAVLEAEANKEA